MPRLFTSHRQVAPQTAVLPPAAMRPRVPTGAVDIAMPSPSPPLQPVMLPTRPEYIPQPVKQQQMSPGEAGPLVLVPPVPKYLLKLMDSHDIDNPYLMAALNVLIENNNNPMRVPDILQAVSKKGWTQVLHKHKDRPEQLFGNALRSHQRRREHLGLPSLVFMIDAGACWKHHELDLSAASGRKKGKIWCFSLDAGFPCPYDRLGLDLENVRRCQHAPGEEGNVTTKKEARQREDSDAEDDDVAASKGGASRKKRKIMPAAHNMDSIPVTDNDRSAPSSQHTLAVRGDVIPAHPALSSLEPPPYVPAALISLPPPHNSQPKKSRIGHNGTGGRSTRATAAAMARSQQQDGSYQSRTRGQMKRALMPAAELDLEGLEGLEAMTPEPEALGDIEDEGVPEEDDAAEDDGFGFYGAAVPFSNTAPVMDPVTAASLSLAFEPAYAAESDDDEDDFHVTMQEFSDDEDMTPVKREDEVTTPSFLFGLSTPFDDFDSSDGGASIARTPTPNLAPGAPHCSLVVDQSSWEAFDSQDQFHSFGLGVQEIPNWDTDSLAKIKEEMVHQGWSRAPSPEFHEQANRLMRPSPLRLDSMELDTAPHSPAGCLGDGEGMGSSSTRSSISGASSRSSLTLSIPPTTPMSEAHDPMLSRRSSVVSSPASFNSPHPLILYSPCLSPAQDPERPLKCGLAHRYIYPSEDATEVNDKLQSTKVRELESLVNFDDADGDASTPELGISPLTKVFPPSPLKRVPWPPSPLALQPLRSPSPFPLSGW